MISLHLSVSLSNSFCCAFTSFPSFQIDPATVKKLDSNLFLGDEITEVYGEIMKTVPKDHLDLENVSQGKINEKRYKD